METQYYTLITHSFGKSLLAWNSKGITHHFFDSKKPEKNLTSKMGNLEFIDSSKKNNFPNFCKEAIFFLEQYFKDGQASIDPKWIDWSAFGDFQTQVYKNLIKVKNGKTLSYKELAIRSKKPLAARAVGSAMRRNPLPIFIPCHRVLKGDGKLGNYSSERGVVTKAELLELESK